VQDRLKKAFKNQLADFEYEAWSQRPCARRRRARLRAPRGRPTRATRRARATAPLPRSTTAPSQVDLAIRSMAPSAEDPWVEKYRPQDLRAPGARNPPRRAAA